MKCILVLLLAVAALYTHGQEKKPLIVNEPFPYAGQFMWKGRETPVSIQSLKGENIIIDLFSSSCVVCFQMLPKVNDLQQSFKHKLRFLLIGYKDAKIEPLYNKFEDRLKLKLEVAFDSSFFKEIELIALPTYIWIRKDGTVAAVTGPSELTEENISKFVGGESLAFGKTFKPVKYDSNKPFLVEGNGGADSNYLVRSLLSEWNPSLSHYLPRQLKYTTEGKNFNVIGVPVGYLYKYVYFGKPIWWYGDSLYGKVWPLAVVNDEIEIEEKPDGNVNFCYSIAYKGARAPDLSKQLKSDLQNYFGYEVEIVKRKMPYWKVSLLKTNKLRSTSMEKYREKSHAGFEYCYTDFSVIMEQLSYYDSEQIPYIDETGINYKVDIKVDALLTNREDFFKALKQAGILVEKSYREMKVLILKKQKDVTAK